MKRETLKTSHWIFCGVAALILFGSGSLAGAQVVTSYNDLAWGTGQLNTNITTITSPDGGSVNSERWNGGMWTWLEGRSG